MKSKTRTSRMADSNQTMKACLICHKTASSLIKNVLLLNQHLTSKCHCCLTFKTANPTKLQQNKQLKSCKKLIKKKINFSWAKDRKLIKAVSVWMAVIIVMCPRLIGLKQLLCHQHPVEVNVRVSLLPKKFLLLKKWQVNILIPSIRDLLIDVVWCQRAVQLLFQNQTEFERFLDWFCEGKQVSFYKRNNTA